MAQTYIVFAGGYWMVSKEFGKQVDREAGDLDKMADYIICIENLPLRFVKPEGFKEHTIYHCEICDRDISEGEMEHKFGCFGHKYTRKNERIEQWDTNKLERYNSAPKKWLKDIYRIWVNKEKGLEKWREIHTYIQGMLPTQVLPQPVVVGDAGGWRVEEEDIPKIILEELPDTKKVQYTCEICGKVCDSKMSLIGHQTGAHKNQWVKGPDKDRVKETEENKLKEG